MVFEDRTDETHIVRDDVNHLGQSLGPRSFCECRARAEGDRRSETGSNQNLSANLGHFGYSCLRYPK